MFDIIIIGGGMAGMTSALYSLRDNKSVLILEKEAVGGQIAKSPRVENYPTIKQISGMELADQLFEQIIDLGVKFELENVKKITKEGNIFNVTTDYKTYQSKAVIIATGAKPRTLGVENEDKLIGNGVYYCAICDGPFYAGQEVVLIGDANSAMQYALMLSSYCKKVKMMTLFDHLCGEQNLQDEVKNSDKIEIYHNMQTLRFVGNEKLEGVIFLDKNTGKEVRFDCPAVFVAIGQKPDNKIFEDFADLDKNGYLIADEKCSTKTPGLYVAGDCRQKQIRQVTTAIGDGTIASINACRYVDSIKD